MYLKTLTMKGFKSFADVVDLEFQPGVTVVVGPNGSGKSNVVDAIAWVLGAQAPTAVRSQKMDDVIFAGTEKRPALGRAEVALTIDNSDGLLPTEFSEVQITRTLFRTGDSEYSLNGVPCRLLDIQELLSDSGVGRTQHVIVSQGQIDAVLNARPEDRRLVIEEAAGVLKFRKRREKAQRRLLATEANLTRIQDLLREVRRQLRPLEKQADAARRHGDVVAELRACQIYLAGRQVASLRTKMAAHADARIDIRGRSDILRRRLASLDAEIIGIESELSARGAVDLGDALARIVGLSQQARGTEGLLNERLRNLDRERQATVDSDIIAALRADSAELNRQLAEVDEAAEALAPDFADLERAEAGLYSDQSSYELALASMSGESAEVAAAGRAAEVRGELAALKASIDRSAADVETIEQRLVALAETATELGGRSTAARERLDHAVEKEASLVGAADSAAEEHATARERLAQLREDRAEAEAVARSAEARVRALSEALASARSATGADLLSHLDGLVGTILDVVTVEPGWEAAVEAALDGVLSAVLVESDGDAREALYAFEAATGSGSVVPLQVSSEPAAIEPGERSILHRVSAQRADVRALLQRQLASIECVDDDWRAALDLSLDLGGRVVVTKSGDRVGGDIWHVGGTGFGATKVAVDEARARHDEAKRACADLDAEITEQSALVARLAEVDANAARALDDNDAELTSTTAAMTQIEADRLQIETESAALASQRDELTTRMRREGERAVELESLLPGLESAEVESAERVRELEASRAMLAARARDIAQKRTDLEVKSAGLDERRGVLRRRLGEVEERLTRLEVGESEAETRRRQLDRTESLTGRLYTIVVESLGHLEAHLETRRAERLEQSEMVQEMTQRLDSLRAERSEAETELRELTENSTRIDIEETETRLRLETATESMRRDLDIDPDAAMAAPQPELDEGVTPAGRVRELERDLKLMGPINPLALQEFEALQERHEFLGGQLEDIRSTRRDLNKVIRAIDDEIVTVFAAAFADVADNFTLLFERLFPGGSGSLKLTEPHNLLDTGIEVSAKPSGKNVKKLSLLSGGERSLTALAFLFAVFRSRPSPFYVMDEVEAALDDVNLHRFLGLVEEFRDDAQLMIVSHQKRTMEAADTLYGVTMEPGGSSRVISERSEVVKELTPRSGAAVPAV